MKLSRSMLDTIVPFLVACITEGRLVCQTLERLLDLPRDERIANLVSQKEHLGERGIKLLAFLLGALDISSSRASVYHERLFEHGALTICRGDVLPQVLGADAKVPEAVTRANEGKILAVNQVTPVGRALQSDDARLGELFDEDEFEDNKNS